MNILICGGSGYIGSRLIPYLSQWHHVTNFDITHGEDIRNTSLLRKFCQDKQVIIYLASMSNNDMCNRTPALATSINQYAFPGVVEAAKGVDRFIYASSVAAYGDQDNATEDMPLKPTTRYGEGKKSCEDWLASSDLPHVIVRAASVCGWSPRMRYDLMVNRMTRDAVSKGIITVNGGNQIRSHIHINDICRLYRLLLNAKDIEGQAFNAVSENMSVMNTAERVSKVVGNTFIDVKPATDDRSYSVSGEKALIKLGFRTLYTINEAIVENYLNFYQ